MPARRILATAVGVFVCATAAKAEELPEAPDLLDSIQQHVESVYAKCREAVVRIEAEDDQGQLSGTGFFIDPNGTLYTSYTIGGESREIVVTQGDLRYPATRLVCDPRSGIAILKVDAKTSFLPIADSSQLKISTPVMTVGYPMDLPLTPSFGFIGGFDRKYLGRFFATTHIRANIPVQRGQGGAPLLNMQGEVEGILISSLDHGNGLFALPINAAEKVHRDFVRFGESRPGWLGLDVSLGPETSGSTAQVQELLPDGPAGRAGICKGDTLLRVGNTKVSTPEDVLDASFYLTAQEVATILVSRDGKEVELQVEPTSPQIKSAPASLALGTPGDVRPTPPLELDKKER